MTNAANAKNAANAANVANAANARLTAVKLLQKMEERGAYSNLLLSSVPEAEKLSNSEKAFAAALFYGVCERRLTLDHVIKKNSRIPPAKIEPLAAAVLRTGLYQLMYMPSVPESAAVNESVKLCERLKIFGAKGFVNGLLRNFVRNGKKLDLSGLSDTERLSVEYSAPTALVEKWINEYKEENAVKALQASIGRPPIYARVNTAKTTADELIKRLAKERITAQKVPWLSDCLKLDKTGSIQKSAAYGDGLFHIQDISSQLCCHTLRPIVNETVLDMCAAPGGKSFTMAELMGNNGKIIALDLHEKRAELVRKGAERLGLRIIEARQGDASKYDKSLPMADKVLCDVPCSGLGVIRRKPEIKYKKLSEFDDLPDIQLKILENASGYVKVGGTLVYSTCTLSRAENDGVADAFAKKHPEFSPIVVHIPCAKAENSFKRTYFPDNDGGDGFFTASFRRVR